MSDFKVEVVKVKIENHPDADRLEIARIEDYTAIVGKGQYQTGDLVAYIPEASIVPLKILEELNLVGALAGSKKNRVKAIRLRGIFSQGLCYPAKDGWEEGDDVTEELGITKYEPPIPAQMAGEVDGQRKCIRYDIQNFKKFPKVIEEGEDVVITEKIHGTWCQIGIVDGKLVVSSKGLAKKNIAFKTYSEKNENNIYLRVAKRLDLVEKLRYVEKPIYILGEVFGTGVQDLGYGANAAQDETLGFRVFDIYEGYPGEGMYFDDHFVDMACKQWGLDRVPVLYRGPFSKEKLLELTDGKEEVSGKGQHIREGVVVRPRIERRDYKLGRVQLKSVSEDYLLRKDGTEYN